MRLNLQEYVRDGVIQSLSLVTRIPGYHRSYTISHRRNTPTGVLLTLDNGKKVRVTVEEVQE